MPNTERATTMDRQIYASSFAISTMAFAAAITFLPAPEGLSSAGLIYLTLGSNSFVNSRTLCTSSIFWHIAITVSVLSGVR